MIISRQDSGEMLEARSGSVGLRNGKRWKLITQLSQEDSFEVAAGRARDAGEIPANEGQIQL